MQVVTPDLVAGKIVLLRLDIDVPVRGGAIIEDFRLKMGLPTIKLCLSRAQKVIIMGHLGRPKGKVMEDLSVALIHDWLSEQGFDFELKSNKIKLLENLRFDLGEEKASFETAKQLANMGDVFVNEAFAAHHPAASTTLLPKLLPHSAGLRFAREVSTLTQVRENPHHPLVVIIGGAKVEDKIPAMLSMSKVADTVLMGGKIATPGLIDLDLPQNVRLGKLNESGTDITPETVLEWGKIIAGAKQILWNGPLGKVEEAENNQTGAIAKIIIDAKAQSIIGGGDTIGYLGKFGLLEKFSFVSTGGGAMLKFLAEGTLPTIVALE